ncbi:MAG: B12-binding domain-containing radical SAM protein [Phycisphaerales bacterium]|nr:B12-binding domain-containing radical SAM protein [Phycisphaerales bacterium]
MKLGLIAMSGVRAWSKELNDIGMTMPGVVERGKVIASMPTLSLLTLAALTPDDIEVSYHEVRDLRTHEGFDDHDFDLVAIASQSAQISDANTLAHHFRARGTRVIMGGIHVTSMPDEALQHADAIVTGEGEPVWPDVLRDARRKRLQKQYCADASFHLADAPIPRYDLLDIDRYNRLLIQTCRGCPHRCDFCASSILLVPGYTTKPAHRIRAELDAITSIWPHPFIELADDNSFASPAHTRAICSAFKDKGVRWFAETDVSIAQHPDLLDELRESGCRQVLLGLESPRTTGLDHIETRANWKLRQLSKYEHAVHTIQSHGITVNGCFVLGLDGDTPEVFDDIYNFADRTSLYDVQVSVLTPFPGTPLYNRLRAENRLLQPTEWSACTLFDVNFQPKHMTPDELQQGLVDLARRLYDPAFVLQRRQRFFDHARNRGWATPE